MKHKFFKIPASDPVHAETELNAFIAQHSITHIDRYFVADGANSFWSLCVTWLDSEGTLTDSIQRLERGGMNEFGSLSPLLYGKRYGCLEL